MAEEMRHRGLQLLYRRGRLRFPTDQWQRIESVEAIARVYIRKCIGFNLHHVVIDEFLREVIDDAFDAAADAFRAARLARFYLAFDLVSFALCAWCPNQSCRSISKNNAPR